MNSDIRSQTFTGGQAAKAAGLAVRRLEGWCEAGLLRPRIVKGATRHGDRRVFTWGDLLVLGVLAELQNMLGTYLRPGGLAKLVVDALGPAKAEWVADAHPWNPDREPLWFLVIEAKGKTPVASILYKPSLKQMTGAIVINIGELSVKLQRALGRPLYRSEA